MAMTIRGSLASFFLRLGRQVWVRAAIFTLTAVVVALAANVLGPLLPFEFGIDLAQNSVGSLLQIIATAMLTVSTFSVTAMVTAFSSATTTATPRSTPLLIADPTSQNAVSTFIGAFTFSLVGIVALSTGYYLPQGRTILFVATLVVIGIVVFTLRRLPSAGARRRGRRRGAGAPAEVPRLARGIRSRARRSVPRCRPRGVRSQPARSRPGRHTDAARGRAGGVGALSLRGA